MLLFQLLQATTPSTEEIAEKMSPDSLATKTAQLVETIRETPPNELLSQLGQHALQFGLKVLAALVIYFVGAWLIRKIRNILARGFKRKETEKTLASFVDSLVSIALWVILIIITVGTLGINTTSLAALLAAGGMAIGMALSGTVQNFAGGIMLLVFKPFKAGDYIEALGYAGTVKEINIVSTKLTTIDNREIILPNGALSNGNINNVSAKDLRRIDQTVSVEYGSDAAQVKEILLDIIHSNPKFIDATTPGATDPFIGLIALKDSSVDFIIRAWVKTSDYWDVWFWLNETVYTQLPQRGVNFPFPQLDVHLKQN